MKKIIILLIIFTSCEKEYNFNEYPKENNIPLRIFNMLEKNSLIKIIDGKNIGTVIK